LQFGITTKVLTKDGKPFVQACTEIIQLKIETIFKSKQKIAKGG